MARRATIGRCMSVMDAFVAATTEVHSMTLVKQNRSDFEPLLVDITPLSAARGYIYNIDRCTAGLDESGFIASHAASANGVVTISMRS